jgi:hypothetical protein
MKKKPNFQKKTLKLQPNHTWQAPNGYKIFVVDRGALSFNIPEYWVISEMDPVKLHDKQPPDDNMRLSVTLWHLPKGVDWTGLPLGSMLQAAVEDRDLEVVEHTGVTKYPREDIEMYWVARRFIDPEEKREAYTYNVVARGFDVQILMTFDFWVDWLGTCLPIWNEILRSTQLGRVIADPTKGVNLQ